MDQATAAAAEAQMSVIQHHVVDGHVAAGGSASAIGPYMQQIINFLLSLVTSGGLCPTPNPAPVPTPATAAANLKALEAHPVACQIELAMANRKQGFPQPRQLAQGMMTALKATPVDELTAIATTAQAMQAAVDGIPE